ncbi:MAG: TrmH family RNA methyltransferase [Isosphaeraceae bacterium]
MPVEPITDLDDPRIAVYRSLKSTNLTRGLPHFVVEGEKLVRRLLESRFPVISILATDRHVDRLAGKLPDHLPLHVIPFEQIHEIVGFPFHRGVLACGKRTAWPSCAEIVGQAGGRSTLVICPQVSNPENLGAIARIGDVLGIDAIVVGPSCPDPFSRRVLRVSMGSVLRLPVIVVERIEDEVPVLLRRLGFELWAAVADPSAPSFEEVSRPERLALLLGDEDRGVAPGWLHQSRRLVTIPMRPGASSLNVSVAAGILLFHLTRQPGR